MAAWETLCSSTRRESVSLMGGHQKLNLLFNMPTCLLSFQRLAAKPATFNSPSSMLYSQLASHHEMYILLLSTQASLFYIICYWENNISSSPLFLFLFFFFLSFLKNNFIYLFLTVLGLCCCAQAFSSCGEWGLLSSCSARAFHCSSFSCCGA